MSKEWGFSQYACIALLLLSISSGLTLLHRILTKILPSTKKKNISIRIPKLMTIYLYITTWILLIIIPVTSSLFCFVDFGVYSIDNHIAAILFTISIIPLIITHISRFALLRIQHGVSNATMSFNLGEITWHQYLDKFEIILQEDYNITNPLILRKYTIYLSLLLTTLCILIIIFTNPFFYIWINCILLGIASVFASIIVWIKSDNFDIKHRANKFRLDSYSILKEMHCITIIFLIQFAIYLCVSTIFIDADMNMDICDATVSTHIILCIGLTLIWIVQLKYALHALYMVAHTAVPLTQLLSSFDGYKAFLRFLVSELSIENLEFFQLSMRWRYRICCWLYGVSNGTKRPAQNIDLPFKIFSFQYVDRLLPQQSGGGLVPNYDEKQQFELQSRDSEMYFTTLPMSRKVSAQAKNSQTTTPKLAGSTPDLLANMPVNGMYSRAVTAPSSLHQAFPPTIVEGDDEEEMTDMSHMTGTTYNDFNLSTRQHTEEDEEYSLKETVDTNGSNHVHMMQSTMIIKQQSLPNRTPTDSNHDDYLRLKKILREDEIIDGVVEAVHTLVHIPDTPPPPITTYTQATIERNSSVTAASSLLQHKITSTPTNVSQAVSKEVSLNLNDVTTLSEPEMDSCDNYKPPVPFISATAAVIRIELHKKDTDLFHHLTPDAQNAEPVKFSRITRSEMDSPDTPEPHTMSMPDIELASDNDEDGMQYVDYHKYETPKATATDATDAADSNFDVQMKKKKMARSVRFASNVEVAVPANKEIKNGLSHLSKLNGMEMVATKSDVDTLPALPVKAAAKLTMHDLLGGHMGMAMGTDAGLNNWVGNMGGIPLEKQTTETFDAAGYNKYSFRDESVVSKAVEPSWFAAWFRKGNAGGQEERAETLLHYSDLSWRRLKKVTRDVNMSAVARGSVDALFKKYARSRYLETKGITLEEYDACMCNAWVSCWENMNDSLRRFAKSGYYENYLASIGQLTIRKVSDEGNKKNIIVGMMDADDSDDNELSGRKLKVRIKGKSAREHAREPAVIIHN